MTDVVYLVTTKNHRDPRSEKSIFTQSIVNIHAFLHAGLKEYTTEYGHDEHEAKLISTFMNMDRIDELNGNVRMKIGEWEGLCCRLTPQELMNRVYNHIDKIGYVLQYPGNAWIEARS